MDQYTSVYENLVILQNFKLIQNQHINHECKRWIDEIKRINSLYNINTKYENNRTIIVNYNLQNTFCFPMDIFLNNFIIIIPANVHTFFDKFLTTIINYLISLIRSQSTVELANETKYRLSIYVPIEHPDTVKFMGLPQYFNRTNGTFKATYMNRTLGDNHCRFDFNFNFNNDWIVINSGSNSVGMEV